MTLDFGYTMPEEVQKLIERVRLAIPAVEISPDGPFLVGGLTVDFRYMNRWVNVEWRPDSQENGWKSNRYGISLITDDTLYGAGADEWIEEVEPAAIRIGVLLAR